MIDNSAESMQVLKETSALGRLIIKPVDKALAKDLIVTNHYSHKWNEGGFGKYNFGVFRAEEPDKCLGVAVYGYMKNPTAKIFTHPNPKAWVCELNRMWIDDTLGKNAESVLIAASLKLLRKADPNIVAVQSFADGRLGCGTIYKASNFRYYGFHYTRFLRNKRTGEMIHEQILTTTTSPTGYLRSNIAYLIGDLEVLQVKTYRYIYPLCKRFRFNGPEKPYPQYEKGIDPVEWNRDKRKIKENIITLLDKVAA
ncbi:hypothetical protein [uncultured Alistipes sp.]|uniref:Mom family adenine methylcarbamoylation protein n=1 Tax=uncultured Alistipes sp. TaxID=538949 RepID=UPI00272CAEB5|nr:hypothetical protein [uncultured Alistipes sp.]